MATNLYHSHKIVFQYLMTRSLANDIISKFKMFEFIPFENFFFGNLQSTHFRQLFYLSNSFCFFTSLCFDIFFKGEYERIETSKQILC